VSAYWVSVCSYNNLGGALKTSIIGKRIQAYVHQLKAIHHDSRTPTEEWARSNEENYYQSDAIPVKNI